MRIIEMFMIFTTCTNKRSLMFIADIHIYNGLVKQSTYDLVSKLANNTTFKFPCQY